MDRDFLKNKRKYELGITLEEAGKRLNATAMMVSYWEKNKKFPNSKNLWCLKELYGLSDEELIEWLKFINENFGDR